MRTSGLSRRRVLAVGALVACLAFSGVVNWIALAAVAAVMLWDSVYMADCASLKDAWRWLRGASFPCSKLEDLTLVLAVTVAAVAFNPAVAIFVDLLLGLLIFAARNAKQPVRQIWTGEQMHSNCARGARELALLVQHGRSIKVLELESELFFGAVSRLDQSLTASLYGAHTVTADWTRVRYIDSSIAQVVGRRHRAGAGAGLRAHARCVRCAAGEMA